MNKRKIINIGYIVITFLLYIAILNSYMGMGRVFSYACIVINFLYSLTFIKNIKRKENLYLQLGLLTTLIADLFLVAIGKYKEIAMSSFFITQISYGLFLLETSKNKKVDLLIRLAGSLFSIVLTIIVLKDKVDYLSIISVCYFYNLILNAILSFVSSPYTIFKIGLILFICCDIFVGLGSAKGVYLDINEGSLIYKLLALDFNFIWFFYVPSQLLISLTFNLLENKKGSN